MDPSGGHKTAARAHLDVAAARGVQRRHRARRAGPHRRRRGAGARRGLGERRRRPAQTGAHPGVRLCRGRTGPAAHRDVDEDPVHGCPRQDPPRDPRGPADDRRPPRRTRPHREGQGSELQPADVMGLPVALDRGPARLGRPARHRRPRRRLRPPHGRQHAHRAAAVAERAAQGARPRGRCAAAHVVDLQPRRRHHRADHRPAPATGARV